MPDALSRPLRASRALAVRQDAASGRPATLDEETRSVEVVASTEEPVWVMDWETWQPVREVLLMSGCRLPQAGRLVLLDAHSRCSVSNVLGSFRELRIERGADGAQLVGRMVFAGTPDVESAWRKVAEGHLTDVSIGYEVRAARELRAGEIFEADGRTFEGPLRVATDWALFELSLCPIGADPAAQVRQARAGKSPRNINRAGAAPGRKEKPMADTPHKRSLKERLRKLLGLRADPEPEDDKDAAAGAREEAGLVDADGNSVTPEELTDEELAQVIDEVADVLDEAEAEEAARLGDDVEDAADAAARKRGKRARLLRALSAVGAMRGDRRLEALAERARITGIRNLARAHDLPQALEDEMINRGTTLERAQAEVSALLETRRGQGPGYHVSQGQDESQKFRAAALDSLLMRCGCGRYGADPRAKDPKPADGADELRAYSLRELAREMLARSGGDARGDIMGVVGRALTTTDLPHLLVETSRRVLMDAFEVAPETWREWASTGSATDFKKTAAIGIEGDVKPLPLPEYGELQEGRLAENAEEYQIATYARKLVISRQAIINDDLNALQTVPRLYGEQTAELVGDVAYAALLDATLKMGDGKPLFDASHKNLFAGKGGTPTVENLGAVVTGMKLQKDSFGRTISIQPKVFLAPVSLEVAAEAFFATQINGAYVVGNQATPLANNPYGGTYFKRVYDRRLDDVDPATWYLLALRNTVTVYFLGGVESPYIESQTNFETDGFESKVRMDVGAKALRWVTMAKATPAAGKSK